MPLMTCCRSNNVTQKIIKTYPQLYFPKYPTPNNNVLPLDYNGKVVKDDQTEIANVIMPYWYYQLIMDYKVQVDRAAAEYTAFVTQSQ